MPPKPPTIPATGICGMLPYRAALHGINLQHAPVVRFRYVGIDPDSVDTDTRLTLAVAMLYCA